MNFSIKITKQRRITVKSSNVASYSRVVYDSSNWMFFLYSSMLKKITAGLLKFPQFSSRVSYSSRFINLFKVGTRRMLSAVTSLSILTKFQTECSCKSLWLFSHGRNLRAERDVISKKCLWTVSKHLITREYLAAVTAVWSRMTSKLWNVCLLTFVRSAQLYHTSKVCFKSFVT